LRPDEKLDEEPLEESSEVKGSGHPHIMLLQTEDGSTPDFEKHILEMKDLACGFDTPALLQRLQEIVPTFISNQASSSQAVPDLT